MNREQTVAIFFTFFKEEKQRRNQVTITLRKQVMKKKKFGQTKISTAELCLYINSSLIMHRHVVITKPIKQSNYLEKV